MKVGDLVRYKPSQEPYCPRRGVGLVIEEPWVEQDPFHQSETFIMTRIGFAAGKECVLTEHLEVVSESR